MVCLSAPQDLKQNAQQVFLSKGTQEGQVASLPGGGCVRLGPVLTPLGLGLSGTSESSTPECLTDTVAVTLGHVLARGEKLAV